MMRPTPFRSRIGGFPEDPNHRRTGRGGVGWSVIVSIRSARLGFVLVGFGLTAGLASAALGQDTTLTSRYTCTRPAGGDANRPHPVCDAQAAVTHGPYVSSVTDTSAIIVWMTDLPAHGKVVYGPGESLDMEAVPAENGMLPVGTLHSVRLTGLRPGTTYSYKVVSTPVLDLTAYWPTTGLESRSDTYRFETFDRRKTTASFVLITDTHGDVPQIDSLMREVDWSKTDFLVHDGDAFDAVTSEAQVWTRWLDPLIAGGLGHSKPLVFVRGNHDTRGPFARHLKAYVPILEHRFYFSRDVGPLHLLVIDTGEDKPDSTQVYAGLNRMGPYREMELAWLEHHVRTSPTLRRAPFRVLLMHQPDWGWLEGGKVERDAWTAAANAAKVDLVIAGHMHRYSLTPAGGPEGNSYPILVVGRGQLAKVSVSEDELRVTIVAEDGSTVGSLTLPRRPD